MSQAVIDFCEGLKAALLGIEEGAAKAKQGFDAGAGQAQREAAAHIEKAAVQLAAFKVAAESAAQQWRADLPEQSKAMREKMKDAELEAHVALRHAMVFLAEAAAKGAEAAAVGLKQGAHHAHSYAEALRKDTAVTVPEGVGAAKTEPPASA